jgi:hypothetical protein
MRDSDSAVKAALPKSGVPTTVAFSLTDDVGESAEHIAFRLFELIYDREKGSYAEPKTPGPADRKYILETYAQCLATVRNPGQPPNWAGLAAALKSP